MILVDTSVWIDHLRSNHRTLVSLLEREEVLTHPFIIGELGCGQIRNRREILHLLSTLPRSVVASDVDVMAFVEAQRLYGRGIGWVDAHLLTSARLSSSGLLTLDLPLSRAAARVGIQA